ncbi:hypothetical protein HQQ80_09645 [Microbacteriaceae bacterium VKM Ac-2855]|nr:hypothetical protein [Microbacteriaceae bacterium VKM Ac-2855]
MLPTLCFAAFDAVSQERRRAFEAAPSSLPAQPDLAGIERWLVDVRLRELRGAGG